jgi:hypothetical protein
MSIPNFIQIRPAVLDLNHADRQTDVIRRTYVHFVYIVQRTRNSLQHAWSSREAHTNFLVSLCIQCLHPVVAGFGLLAMWNNRSIHLHNLALPGTAARRKPRKPQMLWRQSNKRPRWNDLQSEEEGMKIFWHMQPNCRESSDVSVGCKPNTPSYLQFQNQKKLNNSEPTVCVRWWVQIPWAWKPIRHWMEVVCLFTFRPLHSWSRNPHYSYEYETWRCCSKFWCRVDS